MHPITWTILAFSLLALGGAFLLWKKLRESQRLQGLLQTEYVGLQHEKKVIFDFLHDLGEAFTEEMDRPQLMKIIVQCARRVSGARGAALYLWDEPKTRLMAEAITGYFPPPFTVNAVVLDQLTSRAEALEGFLRLEPVPADAKIALAEVARTRQAVNVERAELDERFPYFVDERLRTRSYLAVPLHYRDEQLGVLALANQEEGESFSKSDFEIVKSVADQAAYSLHNAKIYQQLSEKKKLDHEIEVAREIQRILLPSQAPTVEGYTCAALNLAAQQVSGDYYDYIRVDERRLGLVVADVSGKGVPASLVMAMCRSVLRSKAPGNTSPAQVLREVNRQLYADMREDMFITMLYLILEPDGVITLARAGHEAPLLLRNKFQLIETISAPGLALGIDSGDLFDEVIQDVTITLSPQEMVVIYTDGINEAVDQNGNEFGLEQLKQTLRSSGPKGVGPLVHEIVEQVQRFQVGRAQHDDITLAAVQRSL